MDTDLHELYQNIILDHNKRPRNYGALDGFTHSAEGVNPLCGDKVVLFLVLENDRIQKIQFESASCAICKASASIMTQELGGKLLKETGQIVDRVQELLSTDVEAAIDLLTDGELAAFTGVLKFPARIKCALLPWKTLMDIDFEYKTNDYQTP